MKLPIAGKMLVCAVLVLGAAGVGALGEEGKDNGAIQVETPEAGELILQGQNGGVNTGDAMPGTYILPGAPSHEGKRDKCMTVCARWGEDCLLINKGAGGMERKCRRTCKQFAEECF